MSATPSLTQLPAWNELKHLYDTRKINLREAFGSDKDRFAKFSQHFTTPGNDVSLLLDYSKNLIDEEIFGKLIDLAKQANVTEKRDALFRGEPVSYTHLTLPTKA